LEDDEDLIRRGLDSVRLMGLASEWRQMGVEIKFADLLERPTLADWWALVSSRLPQAAPDVVDVPELDETAPFELGVMQHAYWIGRGAGQVLGGVGARFYNEFDGRGIEPARLERA